MINWKKSHLCCIIIEKKWAWKASATGNERKFATEDRNGDEKSFEVFKGDVMVFGWILRI